MERCKDQLFGFPFFSTSPLIAGLPEDNWGECECWNVKEEDEGGYNWMTLSTRLRRSWSPSLSHSFDFILSTIKRKISVNSGPNFFLPVRPRPYDVPITLVPLEPVVNGSIVFNEKVWFRRSQKSIIETFPWTICIYTYTLTNSYLSL